MNVFLLSLSLSLFEYHYGLIRGLMYYIFSMCYNQLQTKSVFKEAVKDRATDMIENSWFKNTVV